MSNGDVLHEAIKFLKQQGMYKDFEAHMSREFDYNDEELEEMISELTELEL